MNWFTRITRGINTKTTDKKEPPEGLWHQCSQCKTMVTTKAHRQNAYVCSNCDYHNRIGSNEYFDILFDDEQCRRLFDNLVAKDVLDFTDSVPYKKRLVASQKKTKLDDAMQVAVGKINGVEAVVSCMDLALLAVRWA